MEKQEIFLDVAHRIGQRIVQNALWEDNACTWQIMEPDRSQPSKARQAKPETAKGALYQGTAGIALFLAELYQYLPEPDTKRAAEGGLRYALAEAHTLPHNSFGFHSGRVGIAYAAVRVALRCQEPAYLTEAYDLLQPLLGNEHLDYGFDVIGGGAGAIPALLQMAPHLSDDLAHTLACNLGDGLINTARKEPTGWSWGSNTLETSFTRNLLGLAHGTAGVGHALLELYHVTGSDKYLYAAEQAFLYERQFFSQEAANWPDFRHTELGEYLYSNQWEALRAVVAAGDLPPYQRNYMSAWCHGAPGIGLTRLRAFELLQDDFYKEMGVTAVTTTKSTLTTDGCGTWNNFSLCHGHGGNSETLLYAAELLDEPAWREAVETFALEGWEQYEKAGNPWPCGTMGSVADPSLMLGEAGIGYFYLRLAHPQVPSVLLLTVPSQQHPTALTSTYQPLQEQYIRDYFGRTITILERFGLLSEENNPLLTQHSLQIPLPTSDVLAAYQLINESIQAQDAPRRAQLEDAFLPERIKYGLTIAIEDYTDEFLDSLVRVPLDEIPWEEAVVQLAPPNRIIHSQWDWDSWLQAGSTQPEPTESNIFFLLYRTRNKIHVRRMNSFAALILQAVENPASLKQIIPHLQQFLPDGYDEQQLRQQVIQQLQQAYKALILTYHQEKS